jgi:hypothetical protein
VISTKTFYCNFCKECITFDKKELPECKCGYIFNNYYKHSNYINMRKTWSGQTKVEFSTMTMDEDIKQRNKR